MLSSTTALILMTCLCYFVNGQDEDFAVSYDKESFAAASADQKMFVLFFAPWCGHCKKLKPTWNDLAKEVNVEGRSVTVGMVDCTLNYELCQEHEVKGYPTMKFFAPGKQSVGFPYTRTMESFKNFIQEQLERSQTVPKEEPIKPVKPAEATNGLYDLTQENFETHISKGHHFVKFFAPWCGHCKRLAPTWEALAGKLKDNKKVTIAKVDCTLQTKVCGDLGVRSYPTLMWFTDGKKFENYNQGRTEDALHGYIMKMISVESEEAKKLSDGKIPPVLDDLKDLNLVELTDDDFIDTVGEDFTFAMFADKQCKSCDLVKPSLEDLGGKFAEKTEFLFAVVYCDEQLETCSREKVVGPYPVFKLYHNGKAVDTYSGERTEAGIREYMERKEKELQPKKPDHDHGGEL